MGYRQHSFDPNAFEEPGRPLRPFNWVQWSGVALGVAGMALVVLDVAGRIGWIAPLFDEGQPFFVLLLIGATLVNSRREASSLVSEEQRARNKRVLIVTLVICAAVLGAAALIESLGA